MAKDLRKKGCTNPDCEMNKKQHKFKATDNYCKKCGAELTYVCAKCFKKIDETDIKHKICAACEAEKADKTPKPIQKIANGAGQVINVVELAGTKVKKAAGKIKESAEDHELKEKAKDIGDKIMDEGKDVAKDIGDKVLKEAKKEAIHKGEKLANEAVKKIVK